MSFNKNLANIQKSIEFSIKQNCQLRTGVELEVSGQSLGSHFLENETYAYVWYALEQVLGQSFDNQLLIELGMPLKINNDVYSALAYIQNGQVLNFQVKNVLVNNEKIQQSIFFKEGQNNNQEIGLPNAIQKITNQKSAKIKANENLFSDLKYKAIFEEELDSFVQLQKPNDLDILNIVSSQTFEAEKFDIKLKKFQKIAKDLQVNILCSGLTGTEGSKFIHQGGIFMITSNTIFELNQRFNFDNIQNFVLDFQQYKKDIQNQNQFFVNQNQSNQNLKEYQSMTRAQEISEANCLYLWNQMFKTKACGFYTPLSGGADSGLTSMFLYTMCKKILQSSQQVKDAFTQLTDLKFTQQTTAKDLVNKIYYTAYLPMNFSAQTKDSSLKLAQAIGSNHRVFSIQEIFDSIKKNLEDQLDIKLDFINNSKSLQQDLILQNIQARSRLVISYAIAQSLVIKYKLKSFLLLFATGNFSEVCRGYYSKYDNSSGDLNLVGSLCKEDIWNLLIFYSNEKNFEFLQEIVDQKPTAELRPENDQILQSDEQDMGFSYKEMDFLGKNWKIKKLGFWKLAEEFQKEFNCSEEISFQKIQDFFKYLKINRHKSICLPPTSHLTDYNIDNNNDIRPMNYTQDETIDKIKINDYL